VAAGQSAKKLDTVAPQRWLVEGGLSYKKGIKDDAQSIFLQEAGLAYKFPSDWTLGVNEAYQSQFTVLEEDRDRWGFEDTEIYLSKGVSDFTFSVKNTFPTSTTSQNASLQFAYSGEAAYSYKFQRMTLAVALELIGYMYMYETVDLDGTEYNAPWAQWYKSELGIKITRGFNWFAQANHYAARNYAGTHDGITRLATGLKYSFNDNIAAKLLYRSQSTVLVNNSFFDDLESLYLFGLIFNN
jgi:hypothetical protein